MTLYIYIVQSGFYPKFTEGHYLIYKYISWTVRFSKSKSLQIKMRTFSISITHSRTIALLYISNCGEGTEHWLHGLIST